MFHAFRVLIATATLTTSGLVVSPPADTSTTTMRRVVITGMTHAERDMALHAIDLFAEAGLRLPPLEIRRHHDQAQCHGHEGIHAKIGERSVIDICTTESDAYEQRVIIHELGHAWSFHFMTAQQRAAFQKVRGWKVWLDYEQATWEANGAEQAAEIIVWALSEHAVPVVKIDQHSCAELRAGYVALTGMEPLHGYTNACKSKSAVARS